ncbi:MAG: cell division protein FtsB [Gammaproteobacteria bacterium]|nr:cell division protein FtsB [Gammaproteobacteria bacterium]
MRLAIVCTGVLLLLVQYSLWVGRGSLADVWRLQHAIAEQRQQNQELAERNQRLRAEVDDLKSGLEVVEERARRELGMIGLGETLFQFVDQ